MTRHADVAVRAALLGACGLGVLCAQTTGIPTPVAGTVLYTKPSYSDAYATANAGMTLVKADSNGLTYRAANGKYALVSGPGLTYADKGQWFPTKLQVANATDGSGWLLAGTSIRAKLNGGLNSDQSLTLSYDSVNLNLKTPKLAYIGQDTFTFQEGNTQWVLRVSEAQITIQNGRHASREVERCAQLQFLGSLGVVRDRGQEWTPACRRGCAHHAGAGDRRQQESVRHLFGVVGEIERTVVQLRRFQRA